MHLTKLCEELEKRMGRYPRVNLVKKAREMSWYARNLESSKKSAKKIRVKAKEEAEWDKVKIERMGRSIYELTGIKL